MNSLEFINQNICDTKNYIKHLEIKIIEDKIYPSFVKSHKERIEEIKPILKHLETIKAKLEAWEVVKECIIDSNGVYLLRIDSDDEDDIEYYETIKKALEVK